MEKNWEDRLSLNEIMNHGFWKFIDPKEDVVGYEEVEGMYSLEEIELVRVNFYF